MKTALLFASVGFVAGIAVALVLAMQTTQMASPQELLWLWPASVFGVNVDGWSDGNLWHFLQFVAAFAGNGVVYAIVAGIFGGLVETVSRKPHTRRAATKFGQRTR